MPTLAIPQQFRLSLWTEYMLGDPNKTAKGNSLDIFPDGQLTRLEEHHIKHRLSWALPTYLPRNLVTTCNSYPFTCLLSVFSA